MRLFVGVPLPETQGRELERSLASLREQLPRLKWVDPGLFHLTLQFLGEVDAGRDDEFASTLETAGARAPFSLRLGEALRLPPGKRARIFALSLAEGFGALSDLARSVTEATQILGIAPERRTYRAHLTLARARRGETLPPELDPGRWQPPELPSWSVESFTLYESLLQPRGPEYRPRHRIELRG